MIDEDIIYAKISSINKCLQRIQDVTHRKPDSLLDIDIQDIFVLNLQRAVQSAIDLAAHVVADEALGLPTSLKENFILLERAGIITPSLASRMASMVGFRNIAVHDYQSMDLSVLQAILTDHLKDLEEFNHYLLAYYHLGE